MARTVCAARDRTGLVFSVDELLTWFRGDSGRAEDVDGLKPNAALLTKKAGRGPANAGPGAASS